MYYLAYYGDVENTENRADFPAATTKIDYISDVLVQNGEKVTIVSPSMTNTKGYAFPGKLVEKRKNVFVKLFWTKKYSGILLRKILKLITDIKVFFFLSKNLKRNEKILVYHSLYLTHIVFALKLFTRCKIVLEVEEIYQDVVKASKIKKWMEYKAFECADSYIFSTQYLNKAVNSKNKPYIVLNGTYKSEQKRTEQSFHDGKIHCVYAGTLEKIKGGAAAAAAAAELLPSNYHIHILGDGTEREKTDIQNLVDKLQKKSKCTLTYDGLLRGEQYIQFLQKCDIGLCTQIPDARYTETSFPSKILVYMANGLRVLSIRIPAVEQSDVGDLIFYYDKQEAKMIAEAIQAIDLTEEYKPQIRLEELHNQLVKTMKNVILMK